MNSQTFSNSKINLLSTGFNFNPHISPYGIIHTDTPPCSVPSIFSHTIYNIYDLLISSYSGCLSVFETDDEIVIVPGSMSCGIYYSFNNPSFNVFRGERDAYFHSLVNSTFQLDTTELVSSLLSHQLCINSPFKTLDTFTHYLPPATVLFIDKVTFKTSLAPIVLLLSKQIIRNTRHLNFDDCLNHSLKSILLQFSHVDLLFSGGLDSSLLYTHLSDLQWRGKCLYKNYNALTSYNDISSRRSQFFYTSKVSQSLSIDLTVVNASYETSNVQYLLNNAVNTSRAFISLKYLPFLSSSSNNTSFYRNVQITGQNADTLFQLDTFAPSTEAVFLKRIILNSEAIIKRSSLYFKIILGRILHFCVPYSDYIRVCHESISNLSSLSEHSDLKYSPLLKKYFPDISHFRNSRVESFSIVNYLSPQLFQKFLDLHFDIQLKLYRHYRTIQNSSRAMYEMYLFNKLDFRVMPFLHGSSYLNLILRSFKLIDIFYPKSSLYNSFYLRNNYSFRSIFKFSSFFVESYLLLRRILTRSSQLEDSFDNDKKVNLIKRLFSNAFDKYDPKIFLTRIELTINVDDNSTFHFFAFKDHLQNINLMISNNEDYHLSSFLNVNGERYVMRLLNLYIFLADLHYNLDS